MKFEKKTPFTWIPYALVAYALVFGIIFLIDWTTPLGVTPWILYFIPFVLYSLTPAKPHPMALAAICTCLVVLGFFVSPGSVEPWKEIVNRAVGISAFWWVSLILVQKRKSDSKTETLIDQLNRAMAAGQVGVWEHDTTAHAVTCSDQVLKFRGISREQFRGTIESLLASIHPADQARMAEAVKSTPPGGQFKLDFRIVRPDGAVRVLEARASSVSDPTGKQRGWVGTETDITEFREAHDALLKNLDLLQRITDNAEVGLTRISRDLVYLSANPAYLKIAGKPLDQVVGHPMIEVIGAKGVEAIRPYVDRVLRGEKVAYEMQLPFVGSGLRHLHVSYAPDLGPNGAINGFVGSITDLTERKNVELEIKRLEEIKRDSAMKDEFLATLSHELRTPLTSALMWAQMLRQKRVAPERIDDAVAAIEKSMLAQNQMIEDLLDVSRIVSGKIFLELGDHDLNLLLHQCVEAVKPLIDANSITIELLWDPQIGVLTCDPTRMKQIIWNLLTNAIKFSSAHSKICLKSFVENNDIKIQVIDQGKGIKPEFLPFVFERFSQEDGSMIRKFGGLGLGLSIVKDLTRLHGGRVSVDSPGEGLGATFTVTLPMSLAKKSMVKSSDNSAKGKALRDDILTGVRILIVDDSADTRLLIKAVLESMGAEVKAAESAKEGLQIIQDYRPNVLLSDISMPEEDGFAFIRQIHALPKERGGETPAIALTANASAADAKKAIDAGFQAHLPKPIEIKRLGSAIAQLLAVSR